MNPTTALRWILPRSSVEALREARAVVNRVRHWGRGFRCPICRATLRAFRPWGDPADKQKLCPVCYSLERHRLVWLYLQQETELLTGVSSILHVAPEWGLQRAFRRCRGVRYLSIDLASLDAQVNMDVTALDLPSNSFDAVLCSHVLEHIPDDRKALAEILRVLKPNGFALLLVPIHSLDRTYEDPALTTPAERLKAFGQEDHVRRCGLDYPDRFREAGFSVDVLRYSERLSNEEAVSMGVDHVEDLFVCRARPPEGECL